MLLDGDEIPCTSGIELGRLLQGNAILKGIAQEVLSHAAFGSRASPKSDVAHESGNPCTVTASPAASFVVSSQRTESAGWLPAVLCGTIPIVFVSQHGTHVHDGDASVDTSAVGNARDEAGTDVMPSGGVLQRGARARAQEQNRGADVRHENAVTQSACMPVFSRGNGFKKLSFWRMFRGF